MWQDMKEEVKEKMHFRELPQETEATDEAGPVVLVVERVES